MLGRCRRGRAGRLRRDCQRQGLVWRTRRGIGRRGDQIRERVDPILADNGYCSFVKTDIISAPGRGLVADFNNVLSTTDDRDLDGICWFIQPHVA